MPYSPVSAVLVLSLCAVLFAQEEFEFDEDALFGDTSTVVDAAAFVDSGAVIDEREQKSVSFSGGITGSVVGTVDREYFRDQSLLNTGFRSSAYGDFSLDIRLPGSVKSFVGANVAYGAVAGSSDTLLLSLNEMFLDWQYRYRVFLRAGKQVLQWGRGFFFNPVDLVNVEKQQFFDDLTGREGAYGLRVHVPFQTRANLYAFLDMGQARRVDDLALSLKAEFLVNSVEFALSAWGKDNRDPVFGLDFSTGLWDFMITGEMALYQSLKTYEFSSRSSNFVSEKRWDWVPRASLGIGRYFDFGDINDRILVNIEGYYNHAGSTEKDLLPEGIDPDQVDVDGMLDLISPELFPIVLDFNNTSRWYLAAFCTINRFILSDMTLAVNALANLNQQSVMLSGALSYRTLHNLSFDLVVSGFPGPDYTEYTLTGSGASIETRVGIVF